MSLYRRPSAFDDDAVPENKKPTRRADKQDSASSKRQRHSHEHRRSDKHHESRELRRSQKRERKREEHERRTRQHESHVAVEESTCNKGEAAHDGRRWNEQHTTRDDHKHAHAIGDAVKQTEVESGLREPRLTPPSGDEPSPTLAPEQSAGTEQVDVMRDDESARERTVPATGAVAADEAKGADNANRHAAAALRATLQRRSVGEKAGSATANRMHAAMRTSGLSQQKRERAEQILLGDEAAARSVLHRHALKEEYDDDPAAEETSKQALRREQREILRSERQAASVASNALNAASRCRLCWPPALSEAAVVSLGSAAYVMVPESPIVPGHCLIVALNHESCMTHAEESTAREVQLYRQSLVKMFFEQRRMEVIFVETALGIARAHSHLVVHCVPMSRADASQAPIYFKKALLEEGEEWSQNRKVIETASRRGIRGTVPQNFAYFNVEFGLAFGYAHVIEDEHDFDRQLFKKIISSVIGASPTLHRQRDHNARKRDVVRNADQLRQLYGSYHWNDSN